MSAEPKFQVLDYLNNRARIVFQNINTDSQFQLVSLKNGALQPESPLFSIDQSTSSISVNSTLEQLTGPNAPLRFRETTSKGSVQLHLIGCGIEPYGAVYSPPPETITKHQSIALATQSYNDEFILQKWIDYHGPIFGFENLYILDDGSDPKLSDLVDGHGAQFISLPRRSFDHSRLARTAGWVQRLLLETYDIAIYTDCDEFLFNMDPTTGLLDRIRNSCDEDPLAPVRTTGWNIIHNVHTEPALNPNEPILRQRTWATRDIRWDKPVITATPVSWTEGFHNIRGHSRPASQIGMLHFRYFDLDFCRDKHFRYKNTDWAQADLERGWGGHQLISDDETYKKFVRFSNATNSPKQPVLAKHAEAIQIPAHWKLQFAIGGV